MNGRLTRDAELRQAGETTVARFSLAVDRRKKDDGTDFINCVAFGKTAEFIDKYFQKGSKIVVIGHIQTGSYTNKEGQKVYTTDVIVDECEFGESKGEKPVKEGFTPPTVDSNGFMVIPEGIDEDLPFH